MCLVPEKCLVPENQTVLLPNKVIIREREFIVLLTINSFNHDGKIKR